MAAKKKEVVITSVKSKLERMMEAIAEETKLAEKSGEDITLGHLDDFTNTGRERYRMTNILGIDMNLYGIKEGTLTVFYGAESSGKSSTSLACIEGFQMYTPNEVTLYVDAEGTVTDNFAERMPYLNTKNVIFLKQQSLEKAFDKVIEYCAAGMVDNLVIDSIDALTSEKELAKSLEQDTMMVKAKTLSRAMSELNGAIVEHGIKAIFIQQTRTVFKGQMAVEGRSGGASMKFYPSGVLKFCPINSLSEMDENGLVKTKHVKIRAEKSKVSRPHVETFTFLNTDPSSKVAIDKIRECVEYATAYGIVKKAGAWITLNDEHGNEIAKVQGAAKLTNELIANVNLYTTIKMMVYSVGLPNEMFVAKFDEIKGMLEEENRLMKENKVQQLTIRGKAHLISENDVEIFEFTEDKTPKVYIGEENFNAAVFTLKSSEEKDKFVREQELKQAQALKITPAEETSDDDFIEDIA
jgi:recombination protein RecA